MIRLVVLFWKHLSFPFVWQTFCVFTRFIPHQTEIFLLSALCVLGEKKEAHLAIILKASELGMEKDMNIFGQKSWLHVESNSKGLLPIQTKVGESLQTFEWRQERMGRKKRLKYEIVYSKN